VLPNAVEMAMWLQGKAHLDTDPYEREQLVVGWSGSATHDADVMHVAKPLKQWFRRHPDVVLQTIGAAYGRAWADPRQVRALAWQKDPRDYWSALQRADIGLAPLKPHPFNAAKSWIRPLELAALGVPCIASRYAEYDRIGTAYTVQHDHEWGRALNFLAESPRGRRQQALTAHRAAGSLTIENTWGDWAEAYLSL
jgi:glycosyltransferase involved in cell wall biosynthesis